MCGIVGHVGHGNSLTTVLEGLKRLEYRGYDSAGVSYLAPNQTLKLLKKEGKLENLEAVVHELSPSSPVGIGHTRWATHGKVNDVNAHPHINEEFAVVHNGIIENAYEIRTSLENDGIKFASETDSEVFLHLLTKFYKQTKEVSQSLIKAFQKLTGNSAFVVIHRSEEKIYAIKRGAPLVCAQNFFKGESFVSSDPYALVGLCDRLFFPADNVLCVLTKQAPKHEKLISFYDLNLEPSTDFTEQVPLKAQGPASKGDFEHFMLKEIYEQPKLIRELGQYYLEGQHIELLKSLEAKKFQRVHIIGCGTAWHAGLLIADMIEQSCGIPASASLASEFRYKNPLLHPKDLCLVISQSGETADTLACAQLCHSKKITCYAIINVENSTIYRLAESNFLIQAGPEIGVASTKAFTLQVLTGELLAAGLGQSLKTKTLLENYRRLPLGIEEILSRVAEIEGLARTYYLQKGFIFTGRGPFFPVALEGALKLKEIAYVHAEGYAAGELKHGPIALIDETIVNVALVPPFLYEKTVSNLEEVKARGGKILCVGPEGDKNLMKLSDHFFGVKYNLSPVLNSLLANVFLQLFSYYVAKLKGTDIDRPRNLAKSVTVE